MKHPDVENWPQWNRSTSILAERVRTNPQKMSGSDKEKAAEIIDAYYDLIAKPQRERNAICEELKAYDSGILAYGGRFKGGW